MAEQKIIKADSWELFTEWFPEIDKRLHKNVTFTKIEMTMEDGSVFIYEKSSDNGKENVENR